MADMARVLLSYHYGGIYLDLDFYCHRPYHCLINKAIEQANMMLSQRRLTGIITRENHSEIRSTKKVLKDVLVVSREPELHAILMHNKPRIIIQDFFMTTPKHPFFLWFLEDRLALFHMDRNSFPSGPFSYHIEGYIDSYYRFKSCFGSAIGMCASDRLISNNLTKHIPELKDDLIIELDESITHPLIDSTNSKLTVKCAELKKSKSWSSSLRSYNTSTLEHLQKKSCKTLENEKYFAPNHETVLVHMWTHVYLGN
jgi:hypothetical protein